MDEIVKTAVVFIMDKQVEITLKISSSIKVATHDPARLSVEA